MPQITLPDGNTLSFDAPVSGADIAMAIGPGLAKKAIAVKVDDQISRSRHQLRCRRAISIITARDDDPDALHVLPPQLRTRAGRSRVRLFPGTKLAYGPSIEGGFFYDLATPRPLTTEDFPAIEERMAAIVKEARPFTRIECDTEAGFARIGDDKYKRDNAERAIAARQRQPVVLRHGR